MISDSIGSQKFSPNCPYMDIDREKICARIFYIATTVLHEYEIFVMKLGSGTIKIEKLPNGIRVEYTMIDPDGGVVILFPNNQTELNIATVIATEIGVYL